MLRADAYRGGHEQFSKESKKEKKERKAKPAKGFKGRLAGHLDHLQSGTTDKLQDGGGKKKKRSKSR